MSANSKEEAFDTVTPPWWATAFVLAMVACSFSLVFYITPLAFVDGNKSRHGGFEGAVEVVEGGGKMLYILASIPFFLIMIMMEFAITVASNLPCEGGQYTFDDTWSSLTAGITQQMMSALVRVPLKLTVVPYSYLHYTLSVPYGLNVREDSVAVWVGGALLVDLCYYWLHRWSHEINILWAGHGVHHSSEHYNLSTALRQSWLQILVGWVVYLPLALFFPPMLYFALDQLNIVYQFWVHTCLVRRLGAVEWVLMTPSHHRVHHDRRLHKNFGGVLIIWDRLFGTFVDEAEAEAAAGLGGRGGGGEGQRQEEVALFGVLPVVASWTEALTQTQLLWPALHPRGAAGLRGLLRALWVGPGYHTAAIPRTLRPPSASAQRIRKVSCISGPAKRYVMAQFVVAAGVSVAVLLLARAPYLPRLLAALLIALPSLYTQGLLLDEERGGVLWERARALALAAGLAGLLLLPSHACPTPLSAALESPSARGAGWGLLGWQALSVLWLHAIQPGASRQQAQ